MPLLRLLRRFLRLEDLLGIVCLAVVSPISGDLFLEGGLATVLLAVAALGWWLAVVLRERNPEGATPVGPLVLFGSIAVAAIMIDAACKQPPSGSQSCTAQPFQRARIIMPPSGQHLDAWLHQIEHLLGGGSRSGDRRFD